MTKLTSELSRELPLERDGVPMHVTLSPDDGGTLRMRWKGQKRKDWIDVQLDELMAYAESGGAAPAPEEEAPKAKPAKGGKAEVIPYEDILSRLHIIPGLELAHRKILVDTIKDLREYHKWLELGGSQSWEAWKKHLNRTEE